MDSKPKLLKIGAFGGKIIFFFFFYIKRLRCKNCGRGHGAKNQPNTEADISLSDLREFLSVVTDLYLQISVVTQKRVGWLDLSSLSQEEKTHNLDVPVDPKGLETLGKFKCLSTNYNSLN